MEKELIGLLSDIVRVRKELAKMIRFKEVDYSKPSEFDKDRRIMRLWLKRRKKWAID